MNIIVTGASKGIGYETVKAFSMEAGSKIVAVSRDAVMLESLKSECGLHQAAAEIFTIRFDLESNLVENELVSKIMACIPSVDVLICNAGLLINKPFTEITDREFDRIINVNVKSVFILVRSLLPHFVPGAHIVNISSMGGFQGSAKFSGLSVYSASKGALGILSECLAEELKPFKIFVNCLALGSVQTEMLSKAFPDYKAPVTANQMAEFIKNFAINGSRFFNGKILPVSLSTP